MSQGITLVARRTIRATPERIFAAWTEPEQLRIWWGPRPVVCRDAVVELRPGGRYRIDNELPDGKIVTIEGEFQVVERPRLLVYTWRAGEDRKSRVTVRFEARGDTTDVIVVHEQIPNEAVRQSHEQGWGGCLDGLERYFAERSAIPG